MINKIISDITLFPLSLNKPVIILRILDDITLDKKILMILSKSIVLDRKIANNVSKNNNDIK